MRSEGRRESEQAGVYRGIIENLESLKRQEGLTSSERHALSNIQRNLSTLVEKTGTVESNPFGLYSLGWAY